MRKHIDAMTREELVAESHEWLRDRIIMTPAQRKQHDEAPLGRLRARVLLGRELDGVPVTGRDAVWDRLKATGQIWWVGGTQTGNWHA